LASGFWGLVPENITARTEPKEEVETFEEGVIPNGIGLIVFSFHPCVWGLGINSFSIKHFRVAQDFIPSRDMGPHIFKIWYYLLAKLFQFVKNKQQFNGRLVMRNLNKLIILMPPAPQ
jgi:hypothetical protein